MKCTSTARCMHLCAVSEFGFETFFLRNTNSEPKGTLEFLDEH